MKFHLLCSCIWCLNRNGMLTPYTHHILWKELLVVEYIHTTENFWVRKRIKKRSREFWPEVYLFRIVLNQVFFCQECSATWVAVETDPSVLFPIAGKMLTCGSLWVNLLLSFILFSLTWHCQYFYAKCSFCATLWNVFLFLQHLHRRCWFTVCSDKQFCVKEVSLGCQVQSVHNEIPCHLKATGHWTSNCERILVLWITMKKEELLQTDLLTII